MIKTIDDERKIKALYHHSSGCGYKVHEDCDAIEAYEENGEMAPQTWFAIYRDDVIWKRVAGKDVTVEY